MVNLDSHSPIKYACGGGCKLVVLMVVQWLWTTLANWLWQCACELSFHSANVDYIGYFCVWDNGCGCVVFTLVHSTALSAVVTRRPMAPYNKGE